MLKQLKAILSDRSETADTVAAKITKLEQFERDAAEGIVTLETEHGEALIGTESASAIAKVEQELDAARLEHTRVTAALEALRRQHAQLSRKELEARATADLKAAVKAVAALPSLLSRYAKAAVPVVDALRTMRRMTDVAIALPRSAKQKGVTGTLGTAKALWREARIPRPGEILDPLWPSDDPDAPQTVHAGGDPRRAGDWPLDLDGAADRADEALTNYEQAAPPLRAVVASVRDLDEVIGKARRGAVSAGLEVPDAVADYKTLRAFLDSVVIPDVPDDAPRLELFARQRRRGVLSAGVQVG